jgi:pyridoxal phosphate enzyme (YggS family)
MTEAQLRDNLSRVEDRIGAAMARGGRSTPVDIIAVTKTHPIDVVRTAIAAGFSKLGENRVLELEEKVNTIGRDAAEWHLIGHLQRNKVKRALPLFDLFHAVDSLRLAQELSAEAVKAGVTVRGLVQVNVSGEETKGGFEGEVAAVTEQIATVCELPGLEVKGLMTMAPFTDDENIVRGAFSRARQLFEQCGSAIPRFDAAHLSMGMSNDYEIAVEEGSTMVRLGTILFGEREP